MRVCAEQLTSMVLKSPKIALILITGLNHGAGGVDADRERVGDVEPLVADDADEHGRDGDVDDGADRERDEDADGHVALGIPRLLRGGGDGVETDVGEEHDPGAAEHPAPPEGAEVPVLGGMNGVRFSRRTYDAPSATKSTSTSDLDDDEHRVRPRRLADADDEERRHEHDDQRRREVEDAVHGRAVRERDERAAAAP